MTFLELNAGNDFVKDLIGLALGVLGNDLDSLFENLKRNGDLDEVLHDLKDDDFNAWARKNEQIQKRLKLVRVSNTLHHREWVRAHCRD